MIQAGANDASYNCNGTPPQRLSQIIPVAVALPGTPKLREGGWATKRDFRTGAFRTLFGVASSHGGYSGLSTG